MNATTIRPEPALVGKRAAEILGAIKADKDYGRLGDSAQRYATCWATFTGYPTIARWDLEADKGPLFVEAMRALALKGSVFDLTGGDEQIAELLLSLPVDEMTHAVLAQHTLITLLQNRIGVLLPHMTDREEFGWEPGDYTEQCYRAAGWGDLDGRYWIGTTEAKRRLGILEGQYLKGGILENGRRHDFDFAEQSGELVAA